MKFDLNNIQLKKFFTILGVVIIFAYWGVWNAFFQQDEWSGLSRYYSLSELNLIPKLVAYYEPLFSSGFGHFLPFLPIVNFVRYGLFGLNYELYAILSIFLHLISCISIFFLIRVWTRDNIAATISSIFFALMPNASQAVTWVGTSLPTQFAFIFSTISVTFWLSWLNSEKKKHLIASMVFAILGIGFKETAIFLFVLLPLVYLYVKKRVEKKIVIPVLLLGLFYVSLRILIIFTSNSSDSTSIVYSLIENFVANYLTVIPKGITQIFIPQEIIYSLSQNILTLIDRYLGKDLFSNPALYEQVLVKPVIYLTGYTCFAFLLLKRKYFYLAYILTALIPIAFITQGELDGLFLPYRALYIPLIGAVGLIGEFGSKFIKEKKYVYISILSLYLLINFVVLKYQNSRIIQQGAIREKVLKTVKTQNPILSEKVVMFLESDYSYYGLPEEEKILPFQSGLGNTLLVWFAKENAFPRRFFENDFLWGITSQGYQEFDGRGFGYFRDKKLLFETLQKHDIASEYVIGYKWHSASNLLQNITLDLRREIEINEENNN